MTDLKDAKTLVACAGCGRKIPKAGAAKAAGNFFCDSSCHALYVTMRFGP